MKLHCAILVAVLLCISCVNSVEPNINSERLLGSYIHGDRRSENHLELKSNGNYIWSHTTHGQQDLEPIIGTWSSNGKIVQFNPNFNAEGNLEIEKSKAGEIILVPSVNVNKYRMHKNAMQNQLDLLAFVRK